MFHAHMIDGIWEVYQENTLLFTLPSYIPFSVVNTMMFDLNRLEQKSLDFGLGGIVNRTAHNEN